MLVGEHFRPGHLVFADESHFNRFTLRRSYGWAPRGNRARRRDFFIRGQKYVWRLNIRVPRTQRQLPTAHNLSQIFYFARIISWWYPALDHSFSGEEFRNFVEGLLDQMQPWPLPNSVLVLDNASIHKIPGIREMVEERCVLPIHAHYDITY